MVCSCRRRRLRRMLLGVQFRAKIRDEIELERFVTVVRKAWKELKLGEVRKVVVIFWCDRVDGDSGFYRYWEEGKESRTNLMNAVSTTARRLLWEQMAGKVRNLRSQLEYYRERIF